jgi:hypothetical protein
MIMLHGETLSPVSVLLQASHTPAMLSTLPSTALM